MTLLENVNIVPVINSQADGQATTSGTILDMAGYDGVLFIAKFGDVDNTSVLTLTAQESTTNAAGGMATLSGSATFTAGATDADETCLALDVHTDERYVRCQVTVATANAELDSVVAIQYGAKSRPVTQTSTNVTNSSSLSYPADA